MKKLPIIIILALIILSISVTALTPISINFGSSTEEAYPENPRGDFLDPEYMVDYGTPGSLLDREVSLSRGTVVNGYTCSRYPDYSLRVPPGPFNYGNKLCWLGRHPGAVLQVFNSAGNLIFESEVDDDELVCSGALDTSKNYNVDIYYCTGTAVRTCTDSDGGKDYDTRGTVTFQYGNNPKEYYEDTCPNSNSLMERYCDSSNSPATTSKSCSCSNGECVQESTYIGHATKKCSSINGDVYWYDSNNARNDVVLPRCTSQEECINAECVTKGGSGDTYIEIESVSVSKSEVLVGETFEITGTAHVTGKCVDCVIESGINFYGSRELTLESTGGACGDDETVGILITAEDEDIEFKLYDVASVEPGSYSIKVGSFCGCGNIDYNGDSCTSFDEEVVDIKVIDNYKGEVELEVLKQGIDTRSAADILGSGLAKFFSTVMGYKDNVYEGKVRITNNYEHEVKGILSMELITPGESDGSYMRQGFKPEDNFFCGRPEDAQQIIQLKPGESETYTLRSYPLGKQEYVDTAFIVRPACWSVQPDASKNPMMTLFDVTNPNVFALVTDVTTESKKKCSDCPFTIDNGFEEFWDKYDYSYECGKLLPGDSTCTDNNTRMECQCFPYDKVCKFINVGCEDSLNYCRMDKDPISSSMSMAYCSSTPPLPGEYDIESPGVCCGVKELFKNPFKSDYKFMVESECKNLFEVGTKKVIVADYLCVDDSTTITVSETDNSKWCFNYADGVKKCYPRKYATDINDAAKLNKIEQAEVTEATFFGDPNYPLCMVEFGDAQCVDNATCLGAYDDKRDKFVDKKIVYDLIKPIVYTDNLFSWSGRIFTSVKKNRELVQRYGLCVDADEFNENAWEKLVRFIAETFKLERDDPMIYIILFGAVALLLFLLSRIGGGKN